MIYVFFSGRNRLKRQQKIEQGVKHYQQSLIRKALSRYGIQLYTYTSLYPYVNTLTLYVPVTYYLYMYTTRTHFCPKI